MQHAFLLDPITSYENHKKKHARKGGYTGLTAPCDKRKRFTTYCYYVQWAMHGFWSKRDLPI